MALTISGFCCNKDFGNDLQMLPSALLRIPKTEVVIMEQLKASDVLETNRSKGVMDCATWAEGSLALLNIADMQSVSMNFPVQSFAHQVAFLFILDGITNSFFLNFYNYGEMTRSLMIQGNEILHNSGMLKIEQGLPKIEHLIPELIREITKIDLFSMSDALKFERYSF